MEDVSYSKIALIGMRRTSNVNYFMVTYNPDSGQVQTDFTAAGGIVLNQTYKITIFFKSATAAGANNGVLKIWVDDTLCIDISNLDNDTRKADFFRVGNNYRTGMNTNFYADNIKIGTRGVAPIAAASSNVYSTALATQPAALYLSGVKGYQEYTTFFLSSDNFWMWESGKLYVYASAAPATRYSTIRQSATPYGINTNSKNHLTLTSVNAAHCTTDGIFVDASDSVMIDGVQAALNAGTGIRISGNSTDCTITRSAIHENGSHGVYFASAANDADGALLAYNLIYRNIGSGIAGANDAVAALDNNTVYNNRRYGIEFTGAVSDYTLHNNSIVSNVLGQLIAPSTSAITHSNNNFYSDSGTVVSYNGVSYTAANLTTFEATAVNSTSFLFETRLPITIQGSAFALDGTIYVGGTGGTVRRSTDGGATFTTIKTFSNGGVRTLFVAANGYLYASPEGESLASGDIGLWRCVNPAAAETTWNRVIDVSADVVATPVFWSVIQTTAGILLAGEYTLTPGHHNANIYRSTDATGASWALCYTDTTVDQHVHDVQYDQWTGYLYAIVDGMGGGRSKTIRSVDGGDNWTVVEIDYPTNIVVVPTPTSRIITSDAADNSILTTTDDATYPRTYRQQEYLGWPWAKRDPITGYVYAGAWNSYDDTPVYEPIIQSKDNGVTWDVIRWVKSDVAFSGAVAASDFLASRIIVRMTGANGVIFDYSKLDDFQLQSTSPCIAAGVDVGLTLDYAGNPVANPPSIGAYEYIAESADGALFSPLFSLTLFKSAFSGVFS